MIDYTQFRELVVVPTLKYLNLEMIPFSEEAVDLLALTAAHESKGGTYLKQIGGPALGPYQMEPTTEEDIWENYLDYRPSLSARVFNMKGKSPTTPLLATNFVYATAMARVHYFRVPSPLPKKEEENYLLKLAEYAKEHYNTHLGKATPEAYYNDFLKWRDS